MFIPLPTIHSPCPQRTGHWFLSFQTVCFDWSMLTHFFSVSSGEKIILVLSVFPQRLCFLRLRSLFRIVLGPAFPEAWFPKLVVLQYLAQNCLLHYFLYCTSDIGHDFLRFGLLFISIKLHHWSSVHFSNLPRSLWILIPPFKVGKAWPHLCFQQVKLFP